MKPVPAASTWIRTLPGPGSWNGPLSCQFQDLGTAELSDTDVLPRHALTVVVIVTGVMRHVAAALNGSLRECCIRL